MPSDHQEPTLGCVRELGLEFHLLISVLCGALYSVISHDEDKRIIEPESCVEARRRAESYHK